MNQKRKKENKSEAKQGLLCFTDIAWQDYQYWQQNNHKTFSRINDLLRECRRTPFTGTGKPEPLVGNLTGYWSRRIDDTNRLVYLPADGSIYVVSCRYHY